MLRTIIEHLSRGRFFKRRLPSRFGRTPLYVSPDAQLKYLRPGEGAFDDELLSIIDEYIHEDSVVWDIGANVGVFAFAAASVARKGAVLAVEADAWLAHLIRRSKMLKENARLNLHVVPCAVADRNGVATFLIAKRGRASNSLETAGGRSQAGGIRDHVTVPTLTLDTFLEFFNPPTFVKIDVEGAEAFVLKGASNLLTVIRPSIYIEVGTTQSEQVTSIFRMSNFALFDASKPRQELTPILRCAYNTLAVPQEKVSFLQPRCDKS